MVSYGTTIPGTQKCTQLIQFFTKFMVMGVAAYSHARIDEVGDSQTNSKKVVGRLIAATI